MGKKRAYNTVRVGPLDAVLVITGDGRVGHILPKQPAHENLYPHSALVTAMAKLLENEPSFQPWLAAWLDNHVAQKKGLVLLNPSPVVGLDGKPLAREASEEEA